MSEILDMLVVGGCINGVGIANPITCIGAKGDGAWVESAGMHDRLTRADRAAHGRRGIVRVEGIVDRARDNAERF